MTCPRVVMRLLVKALLGFALLNSAGLALSERAWGVEPVEIPAEPIRIKPGDPLSSRALVQRPPVVRGVMSWTLETRRHRGVVYHAAISPDGKWLASGGLDGTIRIWDVETGGFVKCLLGHNHYVSRLAWSPDGNTLASAGGDGIAGLWDVKTGVLRRAIRSPKGSVTLVAWSPSGTQLAYASGGSGHLLIYDVVPGEYFNKDREVALGVGISSLVWHPHGLFVGIVSTSTPVTLWELSAVRQNRNLITTGDVSYALDWSRDTKTIAVSGANSIRLYDFESENVKGTIPVAVATALAYSPDGKMLATAVTNGPVQLWDTESGNAIKTLTGSVTTSLSWSADSKLLATTTTTSAVVWDVESGKIKQNFDVCGLSPPIWFPGKPFINVADGITPMVCDPNSGKQLCKLQGHTAAIYAYAWSRDGKLLATGSADATVRLWEMPTGAPLMTYKGHAAAVHGIAWTSDGKSLASSSADKTIRLWKVPPKKQLQDKKEDQPAENGVTAPTDTAAKSTIEPSKKAASPKEAADPLLQEFKGHTGPATLLAAPAVAKMVASGSSDKTIKVWSLTSHKLAATIDTAHAVQALAWSPDGKVLASSSVDDRLHFWNPTNGKLLKTIGEASKVPTSPGITVLTWSPNGAIIGVGRRSSTLQLIDVQTEKTLHSFSGMAQFGSATWTTSGATISLACGDRTVRFWDANTEQLRGHLIAEPNQVVAVSADGHFKAEPGIETELFYVAQTDKAQETLSIAEFAAKAKWKNNPAQAAVIGK